MKKTKEDEINKEKRCREDGRDKEKRCREDEAKQNKSAVTKNKETKKALSRR